MQAFFKAANAMYLKYPQLWEEDFDWQGFQWLDADDNTADTVSFLRRDKKGDFLISVVNFSPVHRKGYRIGVPVGGKYGVVLNSDDTAFGGKGDGDKEPIPSEKIPCHGMDQSITLDLPAMAGVVLRCVRKNPVRKPKAVPAGEAEPPKKDRKARKSPKE